MRLEKKELEELEERKGLTGKTIIQVIWLIISFAVAYFLLGALVDSGVFNYAQIYKSLSLPTTLPVYVVQGTLMLLIVVIMQFILFIGFAFASPEGRRRTGDASMYSRRKDPFDQGGYR